MGSAFSETFSAPARASLATPSWLTPHPTTSPLSRHDRRVMGAVSQMTASDRTGRLAKISRTFCRPAGMAFVV